MTHCHCHQIVLFVLQIWRRTTLTRKYTRCWSIRKSGGMSCFVYIIADGGEDTFCFAHELTEIDIKYRSKMCARWASVLTCESSLIFWLKICPKNKEINFSSLLERPSEFSFEGKRSKIRWVYRSNWTYSSILPRYTEIQQFIMCTTTITNKISLVRSLTVFLEDQTALSNWEACLPSKKRFGIGWNRRLFSDALFATRSLDDEINDDVDDARLRFCKA